MSDTRYPITVQMSEGTLSTWTNFYEYGSWEDHSTSGDEPARYEDGSLHVKEILDRYKTQIKVMDEVEARTVLESAAYFGEGGLWDEEHVTHQAIDRTAARLREAMEA